VLCPGPVRSNLGKSHRNRPADLREGALKSVNLEEVFSGQSIPYIAAEAAGDLVLDAIRNGTLYVFTHPQAEWVAGIRERLAAIGHAIDAQRFAMHGE
jgi:hypothetical protein